MPTLSEINGRGPRPREKRGEGQKTSLGNVSHRSGKEKKRKEQRKRKKNGASVPAPPFLLSHSLSRGLFPFRAVLCSPFFPSFFLSFSKEFPSKIVQKGKARSLWARHFSFVPPRCLTSASEGRDLSPRSVFVCFHTPRDGKGKPPRFRGRGSVEERIGFSPFIFGSKVMRFSTALIVAAALLAATAGPAAAQPKNTTGEYIRFFFFSFLFATFSTLSLCFC
jgi:hypothetical protein